MQQRPDDHKGRHSIWTTNKEKFEEILLTSEGFLSLSDSTM